MIKNIQGYKLSTKDCKVVVKSFSGATTSCMKDYIKPSIKHKPDNMILHCGTNNLKSDSSENICKNIIELAQNINKQNQNTGVIISSLIARGDELNTKVIETNRLLEKACNERNIGFINNNNIDRSSHLNKSRLHLNRNGSSVLAENFKHFMDCMH